MVLPADRQFYITAFNSEECQCGRVKKSGLSFCYKCYFALPKDSRRDLCQKFGDGYEETYDNAVTFLNSE